jgi:ATP-binding protein involved in chromosome partitioning
MLTEERVRAALAPVQDPELHRSIVELGMVREIRITGPDVSVLLALTIPGCPLKDFFRREVPAALRRALPEVGEVQVELTSMAEQERSTLIGGLKIDIPPLGQAGSRTQVLAVGSGKGGVGKSTVAANLAVSLAARGKRVGLLDADIWGFSLPLMMNATAKPTVVDELIVPLQTHGVSMLSMGNFVPEDQPVVWRGPMLHKAMEQLLRDVHWDDPDFLIVDMPPGTGDVAISLSQFLPHAAFLLVTTPQEAASRVAIRAARMLTKTGLRLTGVVENMAMFVCPDCNSTHELFGAGGGQAIAQQLDVPVLARLPFEPVAVAAGDSGSPVVIAHPTCALAVGYGQLADAVTASLGARQRRLLPIVS